MRLLAERRLRWYVHTQQRSLPHKHEDQSCGFRLGSTARGSNLPLEQQVAEGSDLSPLLGQLALWGHSFGCQMGE